MAVAELTLVLSGHLRRPQSADLRPFWRGFIELQKKLPAGKAVRQIVAHSWNPELESLADFVYKPIIQSHELQQLFYPEFLSLIDPPDRFERGLDRQHSTWKNVSIQAVLGNLRSRSMAVKMLDQLPSPSTQVLITRWDLGQSGTSQVNQLVMDSSLAEEYLYLSYFSEVDEGYADMWIVAPWEIAKKFGSIDAFALNCLSGRNNYLQEFCVTGWPRSYVRNGFEKALRNNTVQLILKFVSGFFGDSGAKNLKGGYLSRIKRRLFAPLTRFAERPPITAENSWISKSCDVPRKFPEFLSLNIHAILKYFILMEGLRGRTRFLTGEDFENTGQSGQVINPEAVALLVWSSEEGEVVVREVLQTSALPISAIIQMGTKVQIWSEDQHGEWSVQRVDKAFGSPRDRLFFSLEMISKKVGGQQPILILPSLSKYVSCRDWCYLNALLKYMSWKHLGYVGLCEGLVGQSSSEFPGLRHVKGEGAFNLNMAVGTADGVSPYLTCAGHDLSDLGARASKMMLEFPVVVDKGRLF